MSEQVHNSFYEEGASSHFHKVFALHESLGVCWEDLKRQIPLLPRGWYELASLPLADRIEFTQQFWLSKISLSISDSRLENRLNAFFNKIEEIGIYATQSYPGASFDLHMVYTLKDNAGFFQGAPPASEDMVDMLVQRFPTVPFPKDYLAFMQIHDGFSKYTDTGLIKARDLAQVYQRFQHLLADDVLLMPDGHAILPENLVPFYESYELHCYQCFYTEWHPKEEMGNLHFLEYERSLSNFLNHYTLEEDLAFPTFLSWLVFYLEDFSAH